MGQVQFQSNLDRDKVRRFFIRYQDRLVYGTDTAQNAADKSAELRREAHETWLRDWRYLNTEQTFKDPELDAPVHGLGLPRDVVRKIYSGNAERWYGNPWHASVSRAAAPSPQESK
jgi:predicted TIM-barrel fold metal-dependent hydrolase